MTSRKKTFAESWYGLFEGVKAYAYELVYQGEDGAGRAKLQGHTELTTTQIYTRVSISHLKAIHTATHPGRMAKVGHHPPEAK